MSTPTRTTPVNPMGDIEHDEALALERVALVGHPNTGKTTLFNRLCGVRHKTSNFPGTTQEARIGVLRGKRWEVIDLPGAYSLELNQSESQIGRRVLAGELMPRGERTGAPDAVCVVLDATNLPRGLILLGEVLRRRLPMVVAINMVDAARRRGIHGDEDELARLLGCPVVVCSARTGEGIEVLREAIGSARIATAGPAGDQDALERWADELAVAIFDAGDEADRATLTDRLDLAFTHPVLGMGVFVVTMTLLFWLIFRVAAYPMDWIDWFFGTLSASIAGVLGTGALSDLLANGVVAGVGATLIFLPQIVLLFFLIAVLEDTGYLARAAFVIDRVLRPFGLSGHAFVPLLSSHACAIPGIMAARAIPDRRDRLATILVAPFMSCTARMPVYALLVAVLFPGRPAVQAIAFTGGYVVGALAGLFSALVVRRTILRGASRPMILELPSYRMPSLRTAALTAVDRGFVFLRKAGSVILAISIVLWWLSSYPVVEPPEESHALRAQAAALVQTEPTRADELVTEADTLEALHAAKGTFIADLGRLAQPVFEPLGFDRQLTIGVLASFAAREVFVTTMAVVVTGSDDAGDERIVARIANARRDDGVTAVFNGPTSWALYVYYILASLCLPTLVVTAREAGGVKWALLQFGWMSGLAYVAALGAYTLATALGG